MTVWGNVFTGHSKLYRSTSRTRFHGGSIWLQFRDVSDGTTHWFKPSNVFPVARTN